MAPSNVGAMWKVEARKADSPLEPRKMAHLTTGRNHHYVEARNTSSESLLSSDVVFATQNDHELAPRHADHETGVGSRTQQGKGRRQPDGNNKNNPLAGILNFFANFGSKKEQRDQQQQQIGRQIRFETDATAGASPAAVLTGSSGANCHRSTRNAPVGHDAMTTTLSPSDSTGVARRVSSPMAIGGGRAGWQTSPHGDTEGCSRRGAGDPEDQGGGGAEEEGGEEEKMGRGEAGEVQYARLRGCQSKRVSFTEEDFVPCYATFTPTLSYESLQEMQYRAPETRVPEAVAPPSSVTRPNYHDALRRVAVVVYQHIKTCEWRRHEAEERERVMGGGTKQNRRRAVTGDALRTAHRNTSALWGEAGDRSRGATEAEFEQMRLPATTGRALGRDPFNARKADMFHERQFVAPKFRYTFVQAPVMALPGAVFTLRKVQSVPKPPSADEIYDFIKTLFNKACLSSECSLVCLIYVERLMETARVPLLAATWKPILLCGLLLASKVWQDLSSWNVEFSTVYPEYSLKSINRLELLFLGQMRWDMSISSSLYAKYYFALRSLAEKKDFRRRYNQVMKIDAPQATIVQRRADAVKQTVLTKAQSASMLSKSI